ncbi:unnamed protein product [Ilex paraguariensis]|uniref:Cytochrome P450 n=1 Tax=Ilex paraguariensis TaxID=185542 RepID=A0ABC8R373_9AQUA
MAIIIKHFLSISGFNTICGMVVGKKYLNESPAEQGVVDSDELPRTFDQLFLLTGALNIGDLIPWINFLDLQGFGKKMKTLRKKFDNLLDHIIDDAQMGQNKQKDSKVRTMFDVLMELLENPNLEFHFTRKHIKAVLQVWILSLTPF